MYSDRVLMDGGKVLFLFCFAIILTVMALLFIFTDQFYIDSSLKPNWQSTLLGISIMAHAIVAIFMIVNKVRQIEPAELRFNRSNLNVIQRETGHIEKPRKRSVKFEDECGDETNNNLNVIFNKQNKMKAKTKTTQVQTQKDDKYEKHLQLALKIKTAKSHAAKYDDKYDKIDLKLDHVKLAQKVHNNAVKIESQKLSSAVQIVGTTVTPKTTPNVFSKSTTNNPTSPTKALIAQNLNSQNLKSEKNIKAHDEAIERHTNFVRRATLIAIQQEQEIQQAIIDGTLNQYGECDDVLMDAADNGGEEENEVCSDKASQNTYYSYGMVEVERSESEVSK